MCSLGLLVGIFSAAAPQAAPSARPVVVRFKHGPVVAAHGVRPFVSSGFEIQERRESQFWNPPQVKAMTPKAAPPPAPMPPAPMQPKSMQPKPMQPKSMQPKSMQPKSMQPKPTQPGITQPAKSPLPRTRDEARSQPNRQTESNMGRGR